MSALTTDAPVEAEAAATPGETPPQSPATTQSWPWRYSFAAALAATAVWAALTPILPLVPIASLTGALVLLLVGVCCYTDVRGARIFNAATYPAVAVAFLLNAVHSLVGMAVPEGADPAETTVLGLPVSTIQARLGTVGLFESLLGFLALFAVMFIIFHIARFRGAGDVKLGAALGAWLGPSGGFEVILWCYFIAGLGVVAWLIVWVGPLELLSTFGRKLGSRMLPFLVLQPDAERSKFLQRGLILGPFFALGAAIVLSGANTAFLDLLNGGH